MLIHTNDLQIFSYDKHVDYKHLGFHLFDYSYFTFYPLYLLTVCYLQVLLIMQFCASSTTGCHKVIKRAKFD